MMKKSWGAFLKKNFQQNFLKSRSLAIINKYFKNPNQILSHDVCFIALAKITIKYFFETWNRFFKNAY